MSKRRRKPIPSVPHPRMTVEGIKLGKMLIKKVEPVIIQVAIEGNWPDERCKTCAFRAGTVPNGCPQTQTDVWKAIAEQVPFTCHQADRKGRLCHGWAVYRAYARKVGIKPISVPYSFSPPDQKKEDDDVS